GREIVEGEQRGRARAGYGERLLLRLASRLREEAGAGYSYANLKLMRQFYLAYPSLLTKAEIGYALSGLSARGKKGYAVRSETSQAVAPSAHSGAGPRATRGCEPGRLNPSLSWTHYRALLRVESTESRGFYAIESVNNNWSGRELERQINSLLFERLAKSRDKTGVLRLARKGQEIRQPCDVFKDPVVIEFLGLPESPRLAESSLEQALIDNLQVFLL